MKSNPPNRRNVHPNRLQELTPKLRLCSAQRSVILCVVCQGASPGCNNAMRGLSAPWACVTTCRYIGDLLLHRDVPGGATYRAKSHNSPACALPCLLSALVIIDILKKKKKCMHCSPFGLLTCNSYSRRGFCVRKSFCFFISSGPKRIFRHRTKKIVSFLFFYFVSFLFLI